MKSLYNSFAGYFMVYFAQFLDVSFNSTCSSQKEVEYFQVLNICGFSMVEIGCKKFSDALIPINDNFTCPQICSQAIQWPSKNICGHQMVLMAVNIQIISRRQVNSEEAGPRIPWQSQENLGMSPQTSKLLKEIKKYTQAEDKKFFFFFL